MTEQSLYLVHGIFFEPHDERQRRLSGRRDLNVVVDQSTALCLFSGTIYTNPSAWNLTGELRDGYGTSVLSDITITDAEFSFTKKYLNRPDLIRYCFRRGDDLWVGGYEGTYVGRGEAKCRLLAERPEFFRPPTS